MMMFATTTRERAGKAKSLVQYSTVFYIHRLRVQCVPKDLRLALTKNDFSYFNTTDINFRFSSSNSDVIFTITLQ